MSRRSIIILILSLAAATVVVGAIVALRVWVLNPYRMSGAGMEPSIHPNSVVWVLKCAYPKVSSVQRGDVVAYHVVFMEKREVYMKRVIGLPGDRIRVTAYSVFINGRELQKKPVGEKGPMHLFEEEAGGSVYRIGFLPTKGQVREGEFVVPADAFFVLGDNRWNSLDSRYTGAVQFADLLGKML